MRGRAAVLILISCLAASRAFAAAPVEGVWATHDDHALVEIKACGEALCGEIVTSDQIKAHPDQTDVRNQDRSLRTRPLKGLALFYGLKGGPREWTGGSVYNPQDGKTYHGSIKLVDADTLTLTGCVIAPFCRSETWTRLKTP